MSPDPDPLGRRALFGPAGGPSTVDRAAGKRALFSDAPAAADGGGDGASGPPARPSTGGSGPLTVTCSRCGSSVRVGPVEFVRLQLPVGVWLPRRGFDRWMTCPACRRRAWTSVTLRR